MVHERPGATIKVDKRPGAVTQLQQTFVFKLRVSLCDCIRTDHQFLGKRPDTGQLIAVFQNAALGRMTDLLNQLHVQRLAGFGGQFEKHFNCISYTIQ